MTIPHTGRGGGLYRTWRVGRRLLPPLPSRVGRPLVQAAAQAFVHKMGTNFVTAPRPAFPKGPHVLCCLAALLFRREAIANAHWKLTGRLPHGVADTLAGITPEDLIAVENAIYRANRFLHHRRAAQAFASSSSPCYRSTLVRRGLRSSRDQPEC